MPSPTASEFEYVQAGPKQLLTRTQPFDPAVLTAAGLDVSKIVTAELPAGSELYGLLTSYLASDKCKATKSFVLGIGSSKRGGGCCGSGDDDCDDDDVYRNAHKDLGLGLFAIDFRAKKVHALHQTVGEVVGTDCGATMLKTLVLIAEDVQQITDLCDELIAQADKPQPFKFTVFRFHVQHQYWRRSEVVQARPLESVVLPAALKSRLVDDLDDFLSPGTKQWYAEHGIPYKRSFLLHGSPGAGKTSLIQALAGKYKRNVCYLSPSHPEFTDDALKAAVQRVPSNSIIVLEDVDGIGAAHRVKKDGDKSALTFSGVLNALDGVGGQRGQIFILTTNHRENLDPALIRNGRVDLHVEFTDASEEQMIGLFQSFYAAADVALAKAFAKGLQELLGERTVSMAALQHYFILQRKATAEDASTQVEKVIEEMEKMGKGKQEKKDDKVEEKEKNGEKAPKGKKAPVFPAPAEEAEEDDEDDEEGGTAPAAAPAAAPKGKKSKGGKTVHVHIY